jgi:mono/diheme cytochrome c family protein
MPTFGFDDAQLNALTAYFSAIDDVPYPFDARFTIAHEYPAELVQAGDRLAEEGNLRCFFCHYRGSQEPLVAQLPTWGPDLALAADRLRYEWVQEWIANPQAISPGTSMPQFYTNLDAPSQYVDQNRGGAPILDGNTRRQIEALAAYIMSIGQ